MPQHFWPLKVPLLLTIAQSEDLERVHKIACKIILKDQYISYDTARDSLNIETLEERRLMLCKRFATNCLKYEKTKNMFPLNTDPKSILFYTANGKHLPSTRRCY